MSDSIVGNRDVAAHFQTNTFRILFIALVAALVSPSFAQTQAPKAPMRVKISFTSPAYVGMPIWLTVQTPNRAKIHYPVSTAPSDFGCNTVEVKRDEQLLTPEVHPNPEGRTGAPCGWVSAPNSPESRLPLHIQHLLTKPGTYMVRFTRYTLEGVKNGTITKIVVEESDWTPLTVQIAAPGEIEQWLASTLANLPADPGILVGDALPSLLADRNREVFRAMVQATYNSDEIVSLWRGVHDARLIEELSIGYARGGIALLVCSIFPEGALPIKHLRDLLTIGGRPVLSFQLPRSARRRALEGHIATTGRVYKS